METAKLFAKMGTCDRARVGVVIVRDRHILAHGYNGSPPGMPHCAEVGCEIGDNGGCRRAIHAEANSIAYAATKGVPLYGSTMYTTHQPCISCAQLIVAASIGEVIYLEPYREP